MKKVILFVFLLILAAAVLAGCMTAAQIPINTAAPASPEETDFMPVSTIMPAPVIEAVSTYPECAVRDAPLEISVKIKSSVLVKAYADISQIDNRESLEILYLNETAYGVYTGSIHITYGNRDSCQVTVYAESNGVIVKKTIDVKFQQEASVLDKNPPNDGFDGTRLDKAKWDGRRSAVKDGRLNLMGNGEEDDHVVSRWKFQGDFDVQIDYELTSGWEKPDIEGNELQIWLEAWDYSEDSCGIRRKYYSTGEEVFQQEPHGNSVQIGPDDPKSGKLRLIRRGSVVISLYDLGAGWKELDRINYSNKPVEIEIFCHEDVKGGTFYASFDNFRINSGLTDYKGD